MAFSKYCAGLFELQMFEIMLCEPTLPFGSNEEWEFYRIAPYFAVLCYDGIVG